MKEIKVPIEIEAPFSHYCDGCKECSLQLTYLYSKPMLSCVHKIHCERIWQDFCERGLVKRKEE